MPITRSVVLRIAAVLISILGLTACIVLISYNLPLLQPREVTVSYWAVEREVQVVEKTIGGKKVIVPLQTLDEKAEKREYQATVEPSLKEKTIIWIVVGMGILLGVTALVLLGVHIVFPWQGKEIPQILSTLMFSIFSMVIGAVGGYLGASATSNLGATPNLPGPPPAVKSGT